MHQKLEPKYIPALPFKWLTAAYDPFIKLTMRESMFKRHLMEQADIADSHTVLDLGCGTATLTIMIKKAYPRARVIGLDGDASILAIAEEKAKKEGVDIKFQEAMAYDLPFADGTFDRVISSLVIHHLETESKLRTFREIFRVLRRHGEFHLADFGVPRTFLMSAVSLIVRNLEEAEDNIDGRLPTMMQNAGFVHVQEVQYFSTIFGTLSLFKTKRGP